MKQAFPAAARVRALRAITFMLAVPGLNVAALGTARSANTPATRERAEIGDAVEEIVVTARKRVESLQEVPISAAVLSGDALEARGLATLQEVTATLPSVKLAKGSTTNRQFIRGVGSGDNPSFEQAVGTFIDDIYHGRARSSEASFFDLERIEILKGPQTTYFGNNAIAGALNVVTRDPDGGFSADTRLSYNPKFDGYTAEAGVDVPVGDTLSLRLAGQLSGSDGWIEDPGAGEDAPRIRNDGVRGTLLWRPVEAFTVRLKAQHFDEDQRGGLPLIRSGCPPEPPFTTGGFCAAAIGARAIPFSADFERNTTPGQFTRLQSDDYVATLSLEREPFILTSVTGYSTYDYALGTDLDLTPASLLSVAAPEEYRQFSQELRMTSNDDDPLGYIAGVYYQDSRLDVRNTFNYGFLSPAIAATVPLQALVPFLPFGAQDEFRENAETASAFAALTWKVSDRFQTTAALRYTQVDKDFLQTIAVGTADANYGEIAAFPTTLAGLGALLAQARGLATVGTTSLSRKDEHFSHSLSVQYQANDAVMLYARYDHGFKAGGFNGVDLTGPAAALPFSREAVDALEVGLKSQLFADRLILNAALFRSKYDDLQLAGVVPSAAGVYVNRVQNAGGAISQGIELDATWQMTPQWRTGLSATYLDSHYSSYPNATPTALQTLRLNECLAANSPAPLPPSPLCDPLRVQDLSGDETPFAPDLSASWTLSYSAPIGAKLSWRVESRLFASGRYLLNFNNDPNVAQSAYVREDVTIALSGAAGWEVSVVGQNLTNETIRTYGAAIPATLGSYAFMTELPRNVFVQLRYSF